MFRTPVPRTYYICSWGDFVALILEIFTFTADWILELSCNSLTVFSPPYTLSINSRSKSVTWILRIVRGWGREDGLSNLS